MAFPALLAEALRTRRQFGIGLLRQLRDTLCLRWGRGRLDPWEYYFFQVFRDRYPPAEKRRFIGWRRELELDRLLNRGPLRDIANDKLRFAAYMQARGVPLPRIEAVYAPDGRQYPDAARLVDADALARYLARAGDQGLFVKPIHGAHGRSARAIRGARADGKLLELAHGRSIATSDFVESLGQRDYIFQELLRTPVEIGRICGDRLTSIRAVVLLDANGPQLLSAVWRIPTGTNVTDNFSIGMTGNLVAGIDLETGDVTSVVQGVGWQNRALDQHPDTGGELRGFRLRAWHDARDLCIVCAAHFPELRLQHWDIALTDHGPVVLEINVEGGLRTHQIVAPGPGMLGRLAEIER